MPMLAGSRLGGYHADDLLRRPDGLIDNDYEER
jgi:hypothetical protein